jgi:hypothetical protein
MVDLPLFAKTYCSHLVVELVESQILAKKKSRKTLFSNIMCVATAG